MGLRERNAEQTRELIIDTALALFAERGFEHTRMEEIAERAQIGTSTLYRYFPTKDQLITEPLVLRGQMATELRARPADEPLEVALGHALAAFLTEPRLDPQRLQRVIAVLATADGPRTRLLEEFAKERTLLEQAIADRLDRPADDLFCLMTARLVTTVVELVGTTAPGTAGETLAVAAGILDRMRLEPPVVPRLDRD